MCGATPHPVRGLGAGVPRAEEGGHRHVRADTKVVEQVPCHHLVAAFRHPDCPKDVRLSDHLVHSSLKKWCEQTPGNAIGEVSNPFRMCDLEVDETIIPMPCAPAANGKRKKFGRFKSRLEMLVNCVPKGANGSTLGSTHCTKCGQAGHNATTCRRKR